MSVSKGISRIGQVFGNISGIFIGIVTGILLLEYIVEQPKLMNFAFNGSIRSAFIYARSSLILLATFVGSGGCVWRSQRISASPTVYHWSDSRIKGHLTMCFLAYFCEAQITKLLRKKPSL